MTYTNFEKNANCSWLKQTSRVIKKTEALTIQHPEILSASNITRLFQMYQIIN